MDMPDRDGAHTTLLAVLPSTHVARDFAFQDTYELFSSLDDRPTTGPRMVDEFVDSPFFLERDEALMGSALLPNFTLLRETYCPGDVVDLQLDDDSVVKELVIGDCRFAPSSAGLGGDGEVHAGDFLATLRRRSGLPLLSALLGARADVNRAADAGGVEVAVAGSGCRVMPAEPQLEEVGELHVRHWGLRDGPLICWRQRGEPRRVVKRLEICSRAPQQHRPRLTRPLRLLGSDGIPVVHVCICFYSDDFVPRLHRAASLGGVYMSYASWPFASRTSRHAVRTIAVTPPGVDSDEVLRFVKSDLVVGATEGWVVRDPRGNRVRALADISYYVGDYVQEAKSCGLMGHAALTPCTLCTYRATGVSGSSYGKPGSSADVSLMRTTSRSRAVARADRVAGAVSAPLQEPDGEQSN